MVWKILNPFVGAGMVGFHLLFAGFPQLRNPKKRDNHPIWLAHMVQMGWWKNHQRWVVFYCWVWFFWFYFFFCVWILLSICELESYLDNDKAPDFDRRRKFANGWKLLGCFFLPRFWTSSFESYLSSKDGVWAFKKMRKKSGRKCGRRNFRPKNKKTNAWMS